MLVRNVGLIDFMTNSVLRGLCDDWRQMCLAHHLVPLAQLLPNLRTAGEQSDTNAYIHRRRRTT